MTQINPATPGATATATPGEGSQNGNGQPAATPAPSQGTPGSSQVGTVTIPTSEFQQLARDAARGRSAQRRGEIARRANPPSNAGAGAGNGNPDVAQAIAEANDRAAQAEREATQLKITNGVTTLLSKDEFKALPESTRKIILEKPYLLSDADNVDEALLDIEDYVRDTLLSLGGGNNSNQGAGQGTGGRPATPPGHETPPAGTGAPAPVTPKDNEDYSKLSGPARSQAMIRNRLRGGK